MAASLPNNDDKKWLIFEDDMPIDDFLKRNPPSQIEGSQYSYICVRHSDFSEIKSPDKASLRKDVKKNFEFSPQKRDMNEFLACTRLCNRFSMLELLFTTINGQKIA